MNHDNFEEEFQRWRLNKLNDLKYHRAICMMICGASLADVAKEFKTSVRTIQRFFESPEFTANLHRAIQLTFKSSLSKAALYAEKALDNLIEISEDRSIPVKYRISAIHEIFEICNKAGLNSSESAESAETLLGEKIHRRALLLSHYSNLKDLTKETNPPMANRIRIENEREIWMLLYPDDPYPQEDVYRRYFKENELGEESE